MDELRKKQKKKVEAVMRRNKENEERVMRENKEREVRVLRESNESWALLLDENKAELAALAEMQEKMQEKMARKRKSDGPAAPECPVCFFLSLFGPLCVFFSSLIFAIFVLQVCFTEMKPPTRIFQCLNGHHVCGTCK